MIVQSFPCNPLFKILQSVIVSFILLNSGCVIHLPPNHLKIQPTELDNGAASGCIRVRGKVLGAIIPNSKVCLFQTSSLNYSIVMRTIRNSYPIRCTYVSESHDFAIDCLSTGMYAFVVPTDSYNGLVGSPLPYEFDCPNVSIKIAFQGGDMHYAVGAFIIEKRQRHSDAECGDNPFLCRTTKGGFYRECPIENQ